MSHAHLMIWNADQQTVFPSVSEGIKHLGHALILKQSTPVLIILQQCYFILVNKVNETQPLTP